MQVIHSIKTTSFDVVFILIAAKSENIFIKYRKNQKNNEYALTIP
jgi:hypothetical protein